ncbi:hypothetical protein JHK86_010051 [Glycine max]|nr:hypothetical protein JHK86_010051 [Glycine max]
MEATEGEGEGRRKEEGRRKGRGRGGRKKKGEEEVTEGEGGGGETMKEKEEEGEGRKKEEEEAGEKNEKKERRDKITVEKIGGSLTKRQPQFAFAIEEDTHLISSWLNISTNPIVGVGQGKEVFWLRVIENYNKFRGHIHPHIIPKYWSKMLKLTHRLQLSIQWGRRQPKGREGQRSQNIYQSYGLDCVEETMRERNVLNAKLAISREEELENEYYDILMKDASAISETQLQGHQALCKIIRHKLKI